MLLYVLLLFVCIDRSLCQEPPLESLNIDQDAISVSGFSSGGSMAHFFHVAYSGLFMGAAVMAAVPYDCAMVSGADTCTDAPWDIDVASCQQSAEEKANQGNIDDVTNMADDQIWVFNSAWDTTVNPEAAHKVAEFYEKYGNNVLLHDTLETYHIFPTDIRANPSCHAGGTPYITYCEYDTPYVILNYIYGGELTAPDRSDDTPLPGELRLYDQTEFVDGVPNGHGIGDSGYIYVPYNCQSGETACRLHVALHGCDMHRGAIGDAWATATGYNQVAELNNIVMIYPQATSVMPENPWGCWDWWGFTGQDYATQSAVQMSSMAQMVDRIAGTNSAPFR